MRNLLKSLLLILLLAATSYAGDITTFPYIYNWNGGSSDTTAFGDGKYVTHGSGWGILDFSNAAARLERFRGNKDTRTLDFTADFRGRIFTGGEYFQFRFTKRTPGLGGFIYTIVDNDTLSKDSLCTLVQKGGPGTVTVDDDEWRLWSIPSPWGEYTEQNAMGRNGDYFGTADVYCGGYRGSTRYYGQVDKTVRINLGPQYGNKRTNFKIVIESANNFNGMTYDSFMTVFLPTQIIYNYSGDTSGNPILTYTDTLICEHYDFRTPRLYLDNFEINGGVLYAPEVIATKLTISTEPLTAQQNSIFTPPITVRVESDSGTLVTNDTSHIQVSIGSNPGNGTLSGTLIVPTVNGVATFSNLSIDKVGVEYTLVVQASNLVSDTSIAFDITAIPPDVNIVSSLIPFESGIGRNSTAQSYSITGTNLVDSLLISSPYGFQVSQFQDSAYAPLIKVPEVDGNLNAVIYVRFNSPTIGTFTDSIRHSSVEMLPEFVMVTGTATDTVVVPVPDFPIQFWSGVSPEEKTVHITVLKDSLADSSFARIIAFDPEVADEGRFFVNGHDSLLLFGDAYGGVQLEPDSGFSWSGFKADTTDSWLVNYTFLVPVSWWVNGENEIRVVHTKTYGFRIDTITVDFKRAEAPIMVEKSFVPYNAIAEKYYDATNHKWVFEFSKPQTVKLLTPLGEVLEIAENVSIYEVTQAKVGTQSYLTYTVVLSPSNITIRISRP